MDVLVVSRRHLHDHERHSLLQGLLEISGSANQARPVELTVVVQSDVRPWRFPPTGDFVYGEWLRDEFEPVASRSRNRCPTSPCSSRWCWPATIPSRARRRRTSSTPCRPPTWPGPAWPASPTCSTISTDTRNVVLTFARIWTTLATGQIRSKDAAADWALGRLPREHRPVLEHAKELYLHSGYAEETWSDELKARVRAHVDQVLSEIGRLAPR